MSKNVCHKFWRHFIRVYILKTKSLFITLLGRHMQLISSYSFDDSTLQNSSQMFVVRTLKSRVLVVPSTRSFLLSRYAYTYFLLDTNYTIRTPWSIRTWYHSIRAVIIWSVHTSSINKLCKLVYLPSQIFSVKTFAIISRECHDV